MICEIPVIGIALYQSKNCFILLIYFIDLSNNRYYLTLIVLDYVCARFSFVLGFQYNTQKYMLIQRRVGLKTALSLSEPSTVSVNLNFNTE